MARQGDSQLALSTPALLTDQYLSQRGLHGLSTSAARNVLPLADHAQDFGMSHIFLCFRLWSCAVSSRFMTDFLSISDSIWFCLMLNFLVAHRFYLPSYHVY